VRKNLSDLSLSEIVEILPLHFVQGQNDDSLSLLSG